MQTRSATSRALANAVPTTENTDTTPSQSESSFIETPDFHATAVEAQLESLFPLLSREQRTQLDARIATNGPTEGFELLRFLWPTEYPMSHVEAMRDAFVQLLQWTLHDKLHEPIMDATRNRLEHLYLIMNIPSIIPATEKTPARLDMRPQRPKFFANSEELLRAITLNTMDSHEDGEDTAGEFSGEADPALEHERSGTASQEDEAREFDWVNESEGDDNEDESDYEDKATTRRNRKRSRSSSSSGFHTPRAKRRKTLESKSTSRVPRVHKYPAPPDKEGKHYCRGCLEQQYLIRFELFCDDPIHKALPDSCTDCRDRARMKPPRGNPNGPIKGRGKRLGSKEGAEYLKNNPAMYPKENYRMGYVPAVDFEAPPNEVGPDPPRARKSRGPYTKARKYGGSDMHTRSLPFSTETRAHTPQPSEDKQDSPTVDVHTRSLPTGTRTRAATPPPAKGDNEDLITDEDQEIADAENGEATLPGLDDAEANHQDEREGAEDGWMADPEDDLYSE